MRILLDTHALIWALDDPSNLTPAAIAAIQDPANDIQLSVATIWEMAIKVCQGKLKLSLPFRDWLEKGILDLKLSLLGISLTHAERLASLPAHHKDPFDRLLISQSLEEAIPILSVEAMFDKYGVNRIW
mgnify:CR=1 FL=1